MSKKETYIGKTYIPNDNSYCIDKTHNIHGAPLGRKMLIVSEPYQKFVSHIWLDEKQEVDTFIDVLSYDTGFVYSVLFDESRVGKVGEAFTSPSGVIGKEMLVKDNSYLYSLSGYNHGDKNNLQAYLYKHVVKIISEPYVDKMYYKYDEERIGQCFYNIAKNDNRLFVTVLYNGKPYRVMFYEWWLID